MIKRLLVFVFLTIVYFLLAANINAEDFRSDYQVEYFLTQKQGNLNTRVNFNIQITNLRSDIYVNKFSISFPKNFIIHNLTASDDNGTISPVVTTDDLMTKIDLEFSRPQTGRDTINNFHLYFDQENLFDVNGNIWEVILPTIENRGSSTYKVIVNLPADSTKKISISKPKPDLVTGQQIVWDNPSTKTIYAVFGENQLYQSELIYHIKNPKLTPVYTEIAFPPDTLYQKIYIQSISERPDSVSRDEDSNYLGRYYLNPFESKTITLNIYIETVNKPRDEVRNFANSLLENQKKYLLSPQKYWQISEANISKITPYKSVNDIYYFTVGALKYNYKRIISGNIRLGADQALNKPDQSVCMEFTDLFIAAAREKGILTREIEGYGFTHDPQLRPLSLSSDILHSWPEYYDDINKLWVPVDPTWENTSGIDYFSSFDLNHIVFAIHGKRPDYPLPAGMYKFEKSRDILIKPTTVMPNEKQNIIMIPLEIPKSVSANRIYRISLVVSNAGNVYDWEIPVEINAVGVKFDRSKIIIPVLAPYEKIVIPLKYSTASMNKKDTGRVTVFINGNTAYNTTFTILPYYYDIAIKIGFVVLILTLAIFVIKFLRRRKNI